MRRILLVLIGLEVSYASASSKSLVKGSGRKQYVRSQSVAADGSPTISPEMKSQVFRNMFAPGPGSMLEAGTTLLETPQMFFADLDQSFSASDFKSQSCTENLILLKQLLERNTTLAKSKQVVHVFAQLRDDQRYLNKFRLPLLSFLSTQNHDSTELWLWIDTHDKSYLESNAWRESVEPILFGRSDRVKTKVFDVDKLLGHVPLTQAEREDFRKVYMAQSGGAKKTDLARILILMSYGGIYVDADSVFLQDLRPLLNAGDSWAYDQSQGFLNNAYMNAPAPGSDFTTALFKAAAQTAKGEGQYDFFQFGARLLRSVWDEHRLTQRENGRPFHVLPSCFFEAGPKREGFFTRKTTKNALAYFQDKSPTAFFYHWHDRWDENVLSGSLADCLEQSLLKQLGIPGDGPSGQPDLCTVTEDV